MRKAVREMAVPRDESPQPLPRRRSSGAGGAGRVWRWVLGLLALLLLALLPVAAAYQLAGQTMAVNMMDEAAQEGARAFAEKRPPAWKVSH